MGALLFFFLDATIEVFIITNYDPLIPLFPLLQKEKTKEKSK